jgi:hypothetical protein
MMITKDYRHHRLPGQLDRVNLMISNLMMDVVNVLHIRPLPNNRVILNRLGKMSTTDERVREDVQEKE